MKTTSDMLKTTALALGVLCLGLAGATAADSPKLQTQRGFIQSVDQEHRSLVLAGHKGKTDHTFQWNEQTRFTEGNKAVSPADLKAGEHALLGYEVQHGIAILKSVKVTPANADQQHASRSPSKGTSR